MSPNDRPCTCSPAFRSLVAGELSSMHEVTCPRFAGTRPARPYDLHAVAIPHDGTTVALKVSV